MKLRVLIIVLGAITLLTVAWFLRHDLHGHFVTMQDWVGDRGLWGWIVFVLAFVVLTSVMVPDTLMSIAAGAMWGLFGGLAMIAVSAAVARAVQYVLARRVLRERVQRAVATRPRLLMIDRAVDHEQLKLQFLVRLTPMSPTLLSYLFGSAGVRFVGFMLALTATLPGYFVQVYFGVESTHVAEMSARPDGEVKAMDMLQTGGFIASIIVLAIITKVALGAVKRAAETHDQSSPPAAC